VSKRDKILKPKIAAVVGAVLVLLLGLVLLHVNSRLGLSLRFASYDWSYD
jgi:hypothetical protein